MVLTRTKELNLMNIQDLKYLEVVSTAEEICGGIGRAFSRVGGGSIATGVESDTEIDFETDTDTTGAVAGPLGSRAYARIDAYSSSLS
ncbi:hypothetical protein cce_2675 [Crocosphaera subtropica ATCC 51142]|uniref:Uncharacterized protein n=2 Tax=Crocosphaera TaxID=263510 RepID=B1WTA1_CROS5|nr:hypothetical protein cce_2675 [Crocosphaera subtropica ATCC 51142]